VIEGGYGDEGVLEVERWGEEGMLDEDLAQAPGAAEGYKYDILPTNNGLERGAE
jgi:hypothetical protein